MIPERFAMAMIQNGWILRNKTIWHKPNSMPESVKDRLSTSWEYVYMFAQQQKYWWNLDAIREPLKTGKWEEMPPIGGKKHKGKHPTYSGNTPPSDPKGKNPGNFCQHSNKVGLIWVAGIIDSEGSIYVSKSKRGDKSYKNPEYELCLEIVNTDRRLLERMVDILDLGKIKYKKTSGDRKGIYQIRYYAKKARKVLEKVFPFLITKRKRARLVISLRETKKRFMKNGRFAEPPDEILGKREEIYQKISFYNQYGEEGSTVPDVFNITTKPFPKAHFAVYPPSLCKKPIKAGCPEKVCQKCGKPKIKKPDFKNIPVCRCEKPEWKNGIVLDPFAGAGSTWVMARKLGRDFIGIEIVEEYAEMARERIPDARLDKFL